MTSKYLFVAILLSTITLKVLASNCSCWQDYLCDKKNTSASWRCLEEGSVCCLIKLEEPPAEEITDITCGKRFENGFGFRIEGEKDYEAAASELPWMISIYKKIGKKPEFHCAGTLIEEGIVLTAAHCVHNTQREYEARIFEWMPSKSSDAVVSQVNKVRKIILHPNFSRINLKNDIALLILEKPGFNFSDYKIINNTRICYNTNLNNIDIDKDDCWIAGWGSKQRNKPKTLSRVKTPLVSQKKCSEALKETKLGKSYKLPEKVLCAGGKDMAGKDATVGDGGGPLFCRILHTESNYKQIGIISFGISHSTSVPTIYTNVTEFLSWITDEIKKHNI